jgi:hypothetical protein
VIESLTPLVNRTGRLDGVEIERGLEEERENTEPDLSR